MTRAFKEIINATEADLQAKKAELELELVKLRAQVSTGTAPKNAMQIRKNKRTMARIFTLQKQRELKGLKTKTGSKKRESKA